MSKRPMRVLATLSVASALAPVLAGCAVQHQEMPDRFALGRDSAGDRCTATRSWDAKVAESLDPAYLITCGGAGASQARAVIVSVPAKEKALLADNGVDCGSAVTPTLAGVGAVTVQRCTDTVLRAPAVVVSFEHAGKAYRGAAVGSAVGPLERAMTAMADGKFAAADAVTTPQIAANIPDAEVISVGLVGGGALADAKATLREGIALNRQGRFVEASRLLNDALSRAGADVSPADRIELRLEAGLADSNIRFADAARAHFRQAADQLKDDSGVARSSILSLKLETYQALDALNRRNWAQAATYAEAATGDRKTGKFPLEDELQLARLNGGKASAGASARLARMAAPNAEVAIEVDVIRAQAHWAQSVAALGEGRRDLDAARAALTSSATTLGRILNDQADAGAFGYILAQVERQGARIDVAAAQTGQGSYVPAIDKFRCAIAALRPDARPGANCTVALNDRARRRVSQGAGVGVSPIAAETQMEYASVLAASGDKDAALANFDEAVDMMIASGRGGALPPAGMEVYLRLLAERHAAEVPTSDAGRDPLAEKFFRAVQSVGEPAIARQLSQIQSVVAADPETAKLLTRRSNLTRDVTALGYQIEALQAATAGPGAEGATEAELTDRRTRLDGLRANRDASQIELRQVEDSLQRAGALKGIDDSPVTIEAVQQRLGEGEVYFKIADVRGALFGLAIGKAKVDFYAIGQANRAVAELVQCVRGSIRREAGRDTCSRRDSAEAQALRADRSKLPQFDVASAAALYYVLAGSARDQLNGATKIVYDPSGPLANLPLGVLVTDVKSATAYNAAVKGKTNPAVVNDYSKVAFLAKRADVSTALSPRSFIDARKLAASDAAQPFLGLGTHSAPAANPDAKVRMSLTCQLDGTQLADISRANVPISAEKIAVAANAFGVPDAPRIIGADFTDTGLGERSDLGNYKVLHFATHGLPELRVGCADVPPALLTTLGGTGSDGFLTFDEVAKLKLNANLVVLAACETSASASLNAARQSGQEETGRSLDGLVRAFLAANARAVLATYWKVSTAEESDQLMATFYRTGRTATIGDSLRTAQTGLIDGKTYSHPYFWGGYFLVGDASKTMG